MADLKEALESLKEKVAQPPAMQGVSAVYQFDLEGEGGGSYYVTFTDGAGVISEGKAENPDITITMAASDFMSLMAGNLNPMSAYMSGKLKVKGDMSLAMKLQSLLG